MKINVIGFVLIGLAVVTLVFISHKENGIKTYPSYKDSSMRGFRLSHKEGGKILWEIMSENATFPEGNKEVILKDLTMKIHDKYDITLTGGRGVYTIQDKNLTITKPVIVDIEGDQLTTDFLTWDGRNELITSSDLITFRGKNFVIEGTGLKAEVRSQKVKVLDNVKGIFYR
jgi:LPS export ABC transporter protein LptC